MKDTPSKRICKGPWPSWFAGALLASVLLAAPAYAVDDPWAPGTNWVSFRAGYAKLAAVNAPNGAAGYGIGFSHMLEKYWFINHFSLGAYVHHEVLGQFEAASIVDVPFTVEFVRHSLWNTALRPYVGLGYGMYWLKGYRFPDASGSVRGGGYLVGGANTPLNENSVLGVDARMGLVSDMTEDYRWSIKLNYSWVY